MQEKEENNTKTIHRLSEYITSSGITFNKLALELGLSNSYFSKMVKNNGSIGSDIIENILRVHPNINGDWLLTGRGEMLRNEQTLMIDNYEIVKQQSDSSIVIRLMDKLDEKDAENKKFISELRLLEKELAITKTRLSLYENDKVEDKGLGHAKNVYTKQPSSQNMDDVDSAYAHSK